MGGWGGGVRRGRCGVERLQTRGPHFVRGCWGPAGRPFLRGGGGSGEARADPPPPPAAQARQYIGWFFLLGGGVFCAGGGRIAIATFLGERLTRTLRRLCFEASLRQPMAFFDDPRNSVGRLGTRLATEATLVKGATGESLGSAVEGAACLVCALAISFEASPRLAGVLLAVFPLLILASVFEFRQFAQQMRASGKLLERSGEIVSDAVAAVRSVAAFNLQAQVPPRRRERARRRAEQVRGRDGCDREVLAGRHQDDSGGGG